MKTAACLVALVVATAASVQASPSESGFIVPVHNNPKYKPHAPNQIAKAWNRYRQYAASHRIGRFDAATLPFIDVGNDLEYYALVKVGTPGQTFKLDFDTGSADMWFPYTGCDSSCNTHTKYDPKKSSTYKKDGRPWQISYGDGSSSSGIMAYDTVNIGGLQIKNQAIQLAQRVSSSFSQDVIDGLVGLSFNSITSVPGTKTPIDNLISQGLIKNPIYGVYLGKKSTGGGGEYVFGGYNKARFTGNLTTVPVDKSQGFWGINVNGISVGGKKVAGSFKGIVDTGTTLLLLTNDVASKLAKQLKATDNGDGTYTVSCDPKKLSDVSFSIAGANFKIPAADLIYTKGRSGGCIAGFGYSSISFAILGDVFIKNNYVVFNQKVPQIQMAPVATPRKSSSGKKC